MKTFYTFLITLILSDSAFAAELGVPLKPHKNRDRGYALGVVYTTEGSLEGPHYFLAISPDLPANERRGRALYNYYSTATGEMLFPWTRLRSVSLGVLNLMEGDPMMVRTLIDSQKQRQNETLIVFSTDQGKTISYHLSVADLCRQYPETFQNMTDGTRCDQ